MMVKDPHGSGYISTSVKYRAKVLVNEGLEGRKAKSLAGRRVVLLSGPTQVSKVYMRGCYKGT